MILLTADFSIIDTLPPLTPDEEEFIGSVGSSRRRMEMELTRRLIKKTFGEDCRLGHNDDGAPFLTSRAGYISVSHSAYKVVIAFSTKHRIGIDIEHPRQALLRVASRFLSKDELEVYSSSMRLLLRAWTAKEAIYKAIGEKKLSAFNILLPVNPDDTIANAITSNGTTKISLEYISENPAITLAKVLS